MSYNAIENYVDKMIIWENIKQLKEEERKIILLYYWWGYTDAEIGEILNLSQQLVNYKRKKTNNILRNNIYKSNITLN
jgi:RNA polymerase sigma factor (sigma-70 family)